MFKNKNCLNLFKNLIHHNSKHPYQIFNIKFSYLFLMFIQIFSLSGHSAEKNKAASTSSLSAQSLLDEVSKSYRNAKLVEIAAKKTIKSEILGKETNYDGKIYLSSKLFRWEVEQPEKSVIVFDGNYLWNAQFSKSDKEPALVTQAKVDKKNKSQMLVGILFGNGSVKNQLKVMNEKTNGSVIEIEAVALGTDVNIKNLKMKLDSINKSIIEISYEDDLENLIIFKFTKTDFKNEVSKNLFKFNPPKNAKVTKL